MGSASFKNHRAGPKYSEPRNQGRKSASDHFGSSNCTFNPALPLGIEAFLWKWPPPHAHPEYQVSAAPAERTRRRGLRRTGETGVGRRPIRRVRSPLERFGSLGRDRVERTSSGHYVGARGFWDQPRVLYRARAARTLAQA
jgi:hypothetical protein